MKTSLRATTTIHVPAEKVWDLLVDWPSHGDWIPFTRVRAIRGAGRDVGGRIEAWTGIGRLGFVDPMIITRWDPPHSCEVLHTGRLVKGEAGFDVTAIDADRAEVTWWENIDLPLGLLGAFGWRLTAPLWQSALRRTLDRLRALAEGDVTER